MKPSESSSELTRVVKMTFQPEKISEFLTIITDSKEKIRNFKGCTFFELYSDKGNPSLFFTYSKWESEDDLEMYRKSELFSVTWSRTKVLFSEKAQAWSLKSVIALS
jgi:autoinducer 2-degrading protein